MIRLRSILCVVLGVVTVATTNLPLSAAETLAERPVYLLNIKGAIGPATSDFVERGLEKARDNHAKLVVLRIDTPGGLDTSMREIIKAIFDSRTPVAVFVAPKGARAASAGTYILYAAHIAAMAPATNLGAATPIQIGFPSLPRPKMRGPDSPEKEKDAKGSTDNGAGIGKPHPTMEDKVVNDAVAYIRSLAQLRGRNADWAEKAITQAASLSAEAALKLNVIDLMADDIHDLLGKLEGRTLSVDGNSWSLKGVKDAVIVTLDPDWRTKLLEVLSTPNLVFIFFLAGVYGLVFEFTHPGAMVPGVVGGICLLLALFGLHVLPINYAGLGLILLGVIFMVAEAFIPSFGVLGFGGIIAFVLGSIILLETDAPGFQISPVVIGTIAGVSAIFFTLIIVLVVKARHRPVVSGQEYLIDSIGEVASWSKLEGRIWIHSEYWHATSATPLKKGTKVRVDEVNGLELRVHPTEEEKES